VKVSGVLWQKYVRCHKVSVPPWALTFLCFDVHFSDLLKVILGMDVCLRVSVLCCPVFR
jgi:hypothetical protein